MKKRAHYKDHRKRLHQRRVRRFSGNYFTDLSAYSEGLNLLLQQSPLPYAVAYYLYTGTIIE